MTEAHERVRRQFDHQAERFSNWSVTRNRAYQEAYFDFCGITAEDSLLDFACGTGEYALFAASRVRRVLGIDLSAGMIAVARRQAEQAGIRNVDFLCQPVEKTSVESGAFSVVMCRSAFHHIVDHSAVLAEMVRCCRPGGRISIQDIVAYEDRKVDAFFEALERVVDASHHRTVAAGEITGGCERAGLSITNTFGVEVELNLGEYIGHARQSEEDRRTIARMVEKGLEDPAIAGWLRIEADELFFKRNVFMVLATNRNNSNLSGLS